MNPVPSFSFESCSGCSLCLLPCPVWRQTGDVMLTPKGRAKALQGGARPADLAGSAAACLLCGACEPVCPEGIDTVGMVLGLRVAANGVGAQHAAPLPVLPTVHHRDRAVAPVRLLPGAALAPDVLDAVVRRLGGHDRVAVADDDGRDIVAAIEDGRAVDPEREDRFVRGMASAQELVVAEGLLHRFLRRRLMLRKRTSVIGLGEALIRLPDIRRALRPTDLYVIEPRGYHADFERLVRVYDQLRQETGCQMNLDLHRLAIATGTRGAVDHGGATRPGRPDTSEVRAGQESRPSGIVDPRAQVRWILEGRRVERIVVEDMSDRDVFRAESGLPTIHVAELVAS